MGRIGQRSVKVTVYVRKNTQGKTDIEAEFCLWYCLGWVGKGWEWGVGGVKSRDCRGEVGDGG